MFWIQEIKHMLHLMKTPHITVPMGHLLKTPSTWNLILHMNKKLITPIKQTKIVIPITIPLPVHPPPININPTLHPAHPHLANILQTCPTTMITIITLTRFYALPLPCQPRLNPKILFNLASWSTAIKASCF